ncbi:hypothetical protein [Leuconostoc mesenteroides]|jgi:hypothetical protein|uniref:hypothetical protein n=1 Tax=Leuconostoc mesenteroides TaxID=1245 RepID=UPI001B8AEC9C|nr:hypothetical protein [Leuconostoc mesenteroides]MBS0941597.1 hypothetical protein [Leuconostoc mesenteroides]
MITTIYQDGKEIVVPDGARKGDIVIVNGKKYKVITKDNPRYDSYYVGGDRGVKYFWGFEEVDE